MRTLHGSQGVALTVALALLCSHLAARPGAAAAGTSGPARAPTAPEPAGARFDANGFRLAVPPYSFIFPRDHASHPGYAIEWWYYTGHLDGGGRTFGYELTFFRVALAAASPPSASAWRTRDVQFAHLALTDDHRRTFHHVERAQRRALGLAGADTARYAVWVGDWRAELGADGRTHVLRADGGPFALALELTPGKPPAVHGVDGVSQKSAGVGNASHYYSLTRLLTRGRLVLEGDTLTVTGTSWMDHEFGSGRLSGTHRGWDWFSVQLDDGRELMLYQLRTRSGGIEPLSSGTLIERDGRTRHLSLEAFTITPRGLWRSARTGGEYPAGWRLRLPQQALELEVSPMLADQELVSEGMRGVAYWEGRCRVSGTERGRPVSGQGYVELTGYAGPTPF